MKTKKSMRDNLSISMSLGLLLGLGFTFIAFEWQSYGDKLPQIDQPFAAGSIEVDIPNTFRNANAKPLPPIPKALDFIMVENNTNIEAPMEDEPEIENAEIGLNQKFDELTTDIGMGFETTEVPFSRIEDVPEFPGGIEALNQYLSDNLRYPEQALALDISGKVIVEFVVDEKGNVTKVKVIKSSSDLFNDESVRVIKSMPRWKPGQMGTMPVRVIMNIPISFRLK